MANTNKLSGAAKLLQEMQEIYSSSAGPVEDDFRMRAVRVNNAIYTFEEDNKGFCEWLKGQDINTVLLNSPGHAPINFNDVIAPPNTDQVIVPPKKATTKKAMNPLGVIKTALDAKKEEKYLSLVDEFKSFGEKGTMMLKVVYTEINQRSSIVAKLQGFKSVEEYKMNELNMLATAMKASQAIGERNN